MNKRKLGAQIEQRMKAYLTNLGFVILEMNYQCKQGEIDIIAKDGNYYVFVEVKFRKNTEFGTPEEAVGMAKQRRISKSALYYLYSHNLGEDTPVRFDVAAVQEKDVRYYKNAFSYVG